jgi:hypothetical protein
MLALRPGTLLVLEPGIVLHSLPDQNWFYAFSVTMGDQFRLNRTSFWVLEEINDGIEWTRLRDNYLATFEVSPEQGESDLLQLLNKLYEEKVIRRRDNGKEKNQL